MFPPPQWVLILMVHSLKIQWTGIQCCLALYTLRRHVSKIITIILYFQWPKYNMIYCFWTCAKKPWTVLGYVLTIIWVINFNWLYLGKYWWYRESVKTLFICSIPTNTSIHKIHNFSLNVDFRLWRHQIFKCLYLGNYMWYWKSAKNHFLSSLSSNTYMHKI